MADALGKLQACEALVNPHAKLALAVQEYDDALRRLASTFPRNSPEWSAVMNLARITGNALSALDQIVSPLEPPR